MKTPPRIAPLTSIFSIFLALSLSEAGHAAVVTWGTAANISGDSDVSTLGTKVGAFNIGRAGVASTTINTVLFDPFAITGSPTTVGDFTLSEFPGVLLGDNTFFGSASAPFTSLSASYQSLLQSGAHTVTLTMTLTMNNLSVGQLYQFQWWANNSNSFGSGGITTASATNSVTLDWNSNDTVGGTGQFAIGTFTADNSTQTIDFVGAGSNFPENAINGFQIRIVPEPSSAALGLIGIAALVFRRHRKNRNA